MRVIPNALPTATEGGWRAIYAPPVRGICETSRETKVMSAPDEFGEVAEACRAHAYCHGAFSPVEKLSVLAQAFDVELDALTYAECLRVNLIAEKSGADMESFYDFSEEGKARRAGMSKQWRDALMVTLYAHETGMENKVKNALTKFGPTEWRKPLQQFRKDIKNVIRNYSFYLSSLSLVEFQADINGKKVLVEMPQGFTLSIALARTIQRNERREPTLWSDSEKQEQAEAQARARDRGNAKGKFTKHPEFTGKGSRYDDVRLMDTDLDEAHLGKMAKRNIPSNKGKAPKHVSRMVTDPHSRIFSRKIRAHGGVVLIDQSGSMSLEPSDVEAILAVAGGATVIGYSDCGQHVANVWIHAKNGKRSRLAPMGGSGNGVDASALRYAVSERARTGEPIVWVTDGYAYTKNGGMGKRDVEELLGIITRHGVHMVETPAQAVAILAKASRGDKPRLRVAGYVAELRDYYAENTEEE
jgi:hypothetical protein